MPERPVIAVVGATGQQGGSVVDELVRRGRFRVRALTRRPDEYAGPADEAVAADLARPETLPAAFDGAYGAFAVTNFWEPGGIDEVAQGTAAVRAARAAGVEHFVWSTLPDVERLSDGSLHVPHFTDKARVDDAVTEAGFGYWTFVEAPFYYQNLAGILGPQTMDDGSKAWVLPIDPEARQIHMGDVTELGTVVAGVFEHPEEVGAGTRCALAGGRYSFRDIVTTLNEQGHRVGFQRVPEQVFNGFFPGAQEMSAMLAYFEQFSYFGPDADSKLEAARSVATASPTPFEAWAQEHMPPPP